MYSDCVIEARNYSHQVSANSYMWELSDAQLRGGGMEWSLRGGLVRIPEALHAFLHLPSRGVGEYQKYFTLFIESVLKLSV